MNNLLSLMHHNRWSAHSASCLMLLLFCCAPVVSHAQTGSASDALLEEIVVTATKRDAISAQDIGISLSAVSGDTIEREGYDSFADFATTIAGLSFGERGPGQSLIVIRGVNSSTTQFNTDEPESKETVGVYFDETPVALNGYNPNPRLFDMERIEVLRGPQGTLFGSGSLAGTIRYISRKPDVDNFDMSGGVTISSTNGGGTNGEVNGMLNIPLQSGRSAFRLTSWARSMDGFVDNVAIDTDPRHPLAPAGQFFSRSQWQDVNTDDTWGARAQFLTQPTESSEIIARVYHQQSDFGGYPTEDTFASAEPLPGNDPNNASLGDFQQSRLIDEPSSADFTMINVDSNTELGIGTLTTVTSYIDHEFSQSFETSDLIPVVLGIPNQQFPAPGVLNNVTELQDLVLEIRLASHGESRFNWLLGAFFDSQEKTFLQDAPHIGLTAALASFGLPDLATLVGAPAPGIPDNIFESRSEFDETQIAVFGELSFDLTDRIRLILGARWFDFEQDFFFGDTQGAFATGLTIENRLNEDGINPKLSVELRPTEDILVYGTASQGFRLGGNNDPIPTGLCGVANTDLTFESDSLWNYEIGAKTTFNNRLQINGAAYKIDWEDIPVADSLPCGFAVTRNVGSVDVTGLETDITYAASDRLQLSGNLSYVNSEFSAEFAPLNIVDGTKTPLVPELTANFNAVYRFPMGASQDREGWVSVNHSYRDERFNTANALEQVAMDSYNLTSLRFGIDSQQWKASIFIENLFDERAVLFKDTIFLIENRDSVNRPRTFGVKFLAQF